MIEYFVVAVLGLLLLGGGYAFFAWDVIAGERALSDKHRRPVEKELPDIPTGKVLVLTAGVGGGHEAAGRTVRDELERVGHSVVMVDGLRAMSRTLDFLLVRGYRSQVRNTPRSLGAVFAVTSRRVGAGIVRAAVGLLFANRLLGVVRRERPGLVVSTYPLVTAALGRLRRSGRLEVPVAAIIADYGVHPLWVAPDIDRHLVVSQRSARLAEFAGGKTSLVRMPLEPAFYSAPARAEARSALELPPEAFVALILGGAWGIGDLKGAAGFAAGSGAFTVVVTGNNTELKARLETRFKHEENVRILGWRDDVPVLMAAADCLIQNAGGMTCVEAVEMGLPIIMFEPILGHGELNALVMEQAGAARWVRTAQEMEDLLRQAARREIRLPAPEREPSAPAVFVTLEALAAGASSRPRPIRRLMRLQPVLAGAAALVLFSWLAFASPGVALATEALGLHVPGYKPSPGKAAIAVKVDDPATATYLESLAEKERVPVTIFATARGAEGLRPSDGLAFGVAEEPGDGELSSFWEEGANARAAAYQIRRATGSAPRYFLPVPRANLVALAHAPHGTRLVSPALAVEGRVHPGLLVLDSSGLNTGAARRQFDGALRELHHEGLECVPLARL